MALDTVYRQAVATRRLRTDGRAFHDAYAGDGGLCDTIGDPVNFLRNRSPAAQRTLHDLRMTLVTPYLTHPQRLRVVVFLLLNGLSPASIRGYLRANQSLRDAAAERDVRELLCGWDSVDPGPKRGSAGDKLRTKCAFHLNRNCVCYLDGRVKPRP